MIRTQVYITEQERKSLAHLTSQTGKTQSELIRDAIDLFCAQFSKEKRSAVLHAARGLWKDREDLPKLANLRKEFDRHTDEE